MARTKNKVLPVFFVVLSIGFAYQPVPVYAGGDYSIMQWMARRDKDVSIRSDSMQLAQADSNQPESVELVGGGEGADEGIGETGTDPRDFSPKLMPYYRYTKLENKLMQHEVVLFGLWDFTPKFAMTYEIPV